MGRLNCWIPIRNNIPNERILQDAQADIVKRMPITLKILTMVNSDQVEIINTVISDRCGNNYDGAVEFDASWDAFALYNLSKNYTTFIGTAFVSTRGNNKHILFAVYLDEKLVFYMDEITEKTPPIPFEIDVTDTTTMRIVTDNAATYNKIYAELYFANTSFAKAEGVNQYACGYRKWCYILFN